ncbi:MAG: CocE/NonD family hydrolase [Planctomycetia bacterium]|nr:CocE/NonD family hydrolase [Planctomycetia bacterium]
MRLIACLVVFAACRPAIAQDNPAGELERLQTTATAARRAAAADPTIKNVQSLPVQVYLNEQKRRRLISTSNLRQRIEQYTGDQKREDLIPILKEQLADLERKPLDQVSFDSAYGYEPTTGLVGYSKKVRLIENTSDGKSVILVENAALIIAGLGTSQYPSGKFFNVEKAILIGAPGPEQLFQGNKKKSYSATLVDLEAVLQSASTTSTTGGQVKAHYTKHEFQIPMRDGARLFTTVFAPKDTTQTYPLLMVRTQSGMRPYGPDQYPETLLGPSPLAHFAREGYIFVLQDVRGRWMSEGTFVNMRPHNPHKKTPQDIDESSDTFDTVDWLLKNVPNHNGRVGLYGTSYRGFYVVAGMIDAHPAIRAASPQAPIVDWFMGDDWRHNGALFLAHAFNYMPTIGKARSQPVQEPLFSRFDYGTPDAYDFFLKLGPLANVDARYFQGQVPFWNELLKHDTYDEFWQARVLRPHLMDVRLAVLTVGGWFDAENLFGALETHQRLESAGSGRNNVLVMGPWIHGGWNGGQADGASLGDVSFGAQTAVFFREQIELPFFEFHLKGKGTFKPPNAWIFETGTNKWREEATWPPQNTRPLTFQFQSHGRLAVESGAVESNVPESIATGNGFDEYVSDPARPVPYIDKIGSGMQVEYPCADQRFASRRPDVLTYETDVLQYDVTLAGPIVADLCVSTTGTDSDWIVKVIDVYPVDHPDPSPNPTGVRMGGYQQLVRGDVLRGRFRNSFEKPEPFTPGQPAAVKFKLQDVYHTFSKGHRIMVQVQCSWFPLVDRNPQTFVSPINAKESDFQKTTQRVYRSRKFPSRVTARMLP